MTDCDRSGAAAPRPILLLITSDLFLASRIKGFAEAAGFEVRAGVSERAFESLGGAAPDRVVVDLATRDLDIGSVCAKVGDAAASRVAGYAPHVRVDLLRAARAARLTAVFTRGQLDSELPPWLAGRP